MTGKKRTRERGVARIFIAIPVSLLLMILTATSEFLISPFQEAWIVVASVLIAILLFIFTRDHLVLAMCNSIGLIFSLAFYISGAIAAGDRISDRVSFELAFRIGLVWFCIFCVSLVIRLFSAGKWDGRKSKESFRKAFHLNSLVFLAAYIGLLVMLFVSQRGIGMYSERSLNLIPLQGAFAVYWPHIVSGNFQNGVFIQFFGNLLIFTPLGFYMPVYVKRIPRAMIIVFPILLAGIIETSQYFLKTGKSDVDDFWMNVLGYWIGIMLFYLLGLIRSKVTKGKEKSIVPA